MKTLQEKNSLKSFLLQELFPQITAHGEYIGGFTEFEQWSNGLRRV